MAARAHWFADDAADKDVGADSVESNSDAVAAADTDS